MSVGDAEITEAYSANAEFWVRTIRERRDKYQTGLVDKALLESIGPCDSKVFLDAGCGEGYFSRELAQRGAAHVYGVDACSELIAAAESFQDPIPRTISYHLADVASLPLPAGSVDTVVSNRLPHGLNDHEKRFHEFARVLKSRGTLISLALHPCFYAARDAIAAPSPEEYFRDRTVTQRFEVEGLTSPRPSVQRFFSLEEHTNTILRAGFTIIGLSEPHPTPHQYESDPWWREHFTRPLFLLLKCRLDS